MRILSLFLACLAFPTSAHELWIEPLEWQVSADGTVQAEIVNGEGFEGVKLPYLSQRIARFEIVAGDTRAEVEGRMGDRPALNRPALAEGLNILVYEAVPMTLNYESFDKFQRFVDHKALGDVLPRHMARGLPLMNFEEVYSRHAKSLIAAGTGEGADREIGLETEIVALANPYTDDLSAGLPVLLLYQGAPRAGEQVEIFEKAPGGEVAITTVLTDGEGVAVIPVRPGHAYQLDAVVLREPSAAMAEASGAVWETLWANLTFAVPG